MATRFVRIDLSDASRDHRPVAVEPGLALLDKAGSNNRIVFRWLGGLAADPEWDGDSVNFYVRDDHGGRLEDVVCQPVGRDDLGTTLKHDVELLRDRLRKAVPESSTERLVQRLLSDTLDALLDAPHRTDHDNFFFRYRDVQGRWRLVWCWGFQRADQEPAHAVICTDPDCGLLFVRRPGQSPKCPSCEALLATGRKKRRVRKSSILLGLLLFLLGAGLVYWWLHPERLAATPAEWMGPVGGRVEFRVAKKGRFRGEDVTSRAAAVPSDPRVVRFDPFGATATAVGPGKTAVTFYLGKLSVTTTMEVQPRGNPAKLTIQPDAVELGIGTTARLKLIGRYDDGTTADLTSAAEWLPVNDGIVFAAGGLLEGLAEGRTTVAARYRADPESEYLEAAAPVTVSKFAVKGMEIAVSPDPVSTGRASDLRIDVLSEAGKKYSVLESSRLKLRVEPAHVAAAYGRQLRGLYPGRGRLSALFDDAISAEAEFTVELGQGVDSLVVAPGQLEMVVGEVADLAIVSPRTDPVRLTSSDPKVVEVGRANRLFARHEGAAQVEAAQGEEKRTVEVTVTRADFKGIALRPARVAVPVDHAAAVRVMGRLVDGRQAELAPDLVRCEKAPSPRFAEFDPATLEVRGVEPTAPADPQKLALRFEGHVAEAPVEVVLAPFRLELTPPGKVDVPLGQMVRLGAWAAYGDGLRVQVLPGRIAWKSDPASGSVPGLDFRGGRVAALKAGAGPLAVWGSYFGRESNRVECRSVEAEPVELRVEVDRALRIAGEPGRAVLAGTGPKGDVELVPELARFRASQPDVLRIDGESGEFRAVSPGTATVAAEHPAASKPAERELTVLDPDKAELVFEPAALRLAVDEVAPLRLFLESRDGAPGKREELAGPDVQFSVARPEAVSFRPPLVRGVRAAAPFNVVAAFRPWLQKTAAAQVEVVEAAEAGALRAAPGAITLAPGQAVALRVEAQAASSDEWQEVHPAAAAWRVPAALMWVPASGDLRPMVAAPPGASGEFILEAAARGRAAECKVTVQAEGPAGQDLIVVREPEGRYLPAGAQQRYSVMVRTEDGLRPAAGVQWQPDFENDYASWKAPVLFARRGGHVQWLEAAVEGRAVRWWTCTYDPRAYDEPPAPPPGDHPVAVRILSDQGQSVRFAAGAEFNDFRVEAEYADGFTRLVTAKATLRTPESAEEAVVAPRDGRLIGLRPGRTLVQAEFEGVGSKTGLGVEVTAGLDIDEIRLAPSPLTMLPGETVGLEAIGYKAGKSAGVITGLGGLEWKSSNEEVARLSGPAVTAGHRGSALVTAQRGGLTSRPAEIAVVGAIADGLVAEPGRLRIRVGEAVRVGTDVIVSRGGTDLSRQVTVYPALKEVVRYDPATHSLVGLAPGVTPVSFILGKQLADMFVEVVAGGAIEGEVVVEPSSVVLAAGQAVRPRVFIVSKDGFRYDQTSAATLTSSAPDKVTVRGFRPTDRADSLFALALGTAEITATVPGATQPGKAFVSVTGERIAGLAVDPPALNLAAGDRVGLRILGRAPSGAYELYPQDQLRLAPGGPDPAAIRIVDPNEVEGARAGQAEVIVSYGPDLAARVPVSVGDSAVSDLTIEPAQAAIQPGQGLVYRVTGVVAGQRRVLGPEHGVQLGVREPAVAQVVGPMTVGGSQPGRTGVVASLGSQQAEAVLDVAPGGVVPGGDVVVGPLGRVIHRDADGSVWIDGRRYVYRHGRGWVVVDPGRVIGPGAVDVAPRAGVAALRFVPDALRVPVGSEGAGVKVVEVLADGAVGRDVTTDPGLELTQPPDVARVEMTPAGPVVRPVGTGETRVGARIGLVTAEAPLKVTVSGDRFLNVETKPNWGEHDFSVSIQVQSAATEGPLEYRVYGEGNPPPETWAPSQPAGDRRQVTVDSPRLPYRGEGAQYNLVVEARDPAGGIVQRYPFTFRLVRDIVRTDKP